MKLNISLKKLLYILFISLLLGFTHNFISPKGIPLVKEEIILGSFTDDDINKDGAAGLDYSKIKTIDLENAFKLFNKGVKFVDVRDQWDFADGHVSGAVNLPEVEFNTKHEALSKLSKDESLILYCSSDDCGLSTKVAIELLKLGYQYLYVFEKGWEIWLDSGYPVEVGGDL